MAAATALGPRLLAEAMGTLALLAVVVGSGIMGVRLGAGNDAVALLANAGATAAALYVLISVLGPLSGAHFNPLVSLVSCWRGELSRRDCLAYIPVQVVAALAGVLLAHGMFELPLLQAGSKLRSGPAQWLSELVATAGLVLTIALGVRHRAAAVPALVASWIFAAYWFTASTSFANPAVTLARAFTDTFANIRLVDVGPFVLAQLLGGVLALALLRGLK